MGTSLRKTSYSHIRHIPPLSNAKKSGSDHAAINSLFQVNCLSDGDMLCATTATAPTDHDGADRSVHHSEQQPTDRRCNKRPQPARTLPAAPPDPYRDQARNRQVDIMSIIGSSFEPG